ncbi:hypothetical protein Tco_0670878 [Tanacetum coccineum]
MSLEESDDLGILDAEPVDPVLEASALPKFDMHMYTSSLTETNLKWLTKCYGIPVDLHPRVVSEGMTMNALPNDAIGLYAHHFQQGGLRVPFSSFFLKVVEHFCVHISQLIPLGINRVTFFELYCRALDIIPIVPLFHAAPIAMAWRHHDSSVVDPFPKPTEYNASDVTKLREVFISLRKPPPSLLYVAGISNVWKHAGRVFSLKDSKGKVVTMAEFLRLPNFKGCKIVGGDLLPLGSARVLDNKEKKKRKAEEKDAANAPAANIQAERVARNKDAGKQGARKKRRVHARNPVRPDSEHVSSPIPLNHAKPLETLADEDYVSPNVSAGRMGVLRNQTDEHVTPPPGVNAGGFVRGGEGVQENLDVAFVRECHGDNEGELSGLQTQPSPIHHAGPLFETVERPERTKVIPLAVRKLTLYSSMGPDGFFPYGQLSPMSWKMLCQSAQQQANALLRFEALMEEHADLVYAHESCKNADRIKQLEEALKQSEADAHQLRLEREKFDVEAGNEEMVRRRIINQYLPTFVRRLHQSAEYKRSLGEVFSLAVGKGFIDWISIGRKDPDIQAILKATPNVDLASSDIFIDKYEQLFDQRYPYVDKVAYMYLLDPSGLQNVMPDETGPTPGGGTRDTPMASYA